MGTRRSHCNLSLLLLLFSVLVSKGSSYHGAVKVQNDIQGNQVSLDMHCRSNDDDLGQRTLHQGQEWHWNFGVAAGFTYFWCDFRWYDNQDKRWYHGTFDVYHANGLVDSYISYCGGSCQWSARRDGFYLFRNDRPYLKDAWEKRDEWQVGSWKV
ncbi:self-incompatibility protein S1-like [Papaver somniferum]|uniref:self-incompatibility protein S1-like n=1 Tax=Papaver somniferum TaxID=3469 RepID=UPI000E6F8D2D|nr:self-incompatibility protein S1-like [Papaver somniferum]